VPGAEGPLPELLEPLEPLDDRWPVNFRAKTIAATISPMTMKIMKNNSQPFILQGY
jgi:hypothetical protein